MRAYFFTFLGVSIFLFVIVMSQIRAALLEVQQEQEAWMSVRISEKRGE